MNVWKIPCNSNFTVTYPFGVYDENLNITSDHRHHGVDMVISDKKVISAHPGKVIFAGWNNSGFGNLVIVQSGEYQLYYAHLKEIHVKYDQLVDYTTQIGVQGATGYVTGEHLHFEVRKNNQVIDASVFMGIPNTYGEKDPHNYAFELDKPQDNPTAQLNYRVGQLVVYSTYYNDPNGVTPIDCIQNHGAWQQDYIGEIITGASQPYRLKTFTNRYLNNGDIREVK